MPHPLRSVAPLLLAATLLALASPSRAQSRAEVERQLEGVEVVERLGAAVPLDLPFVDEEGRQSALRHHAGRPTLLTFNYASCPSLCSLQLAGLAKGLKAIGDRPLPDFEIVTVSVDPDQEVAEAGRAKQIYVRQAGGSARIGQAWHFLVGEQASIAAAAESVGFRYRYDPDTREYRHKATLVALTPDGRVSSYIHGINYEPAALETALVRASRGEIFSPDEQRGVVGFLLDCFRFDPSRPIPIGLRAMRGAGLVLLVGLAAFLGRLAWRDSRSNKLERRA